MSAALPSSPPGASQAAALVAAVALSAWPALAAGFVDPLDEPAARSALAASRGWLLDVAPAGDRLVAVGQRGHAVWSDDGGASWTQAAVPVSTDLTAVHFASPARGWAVGHDGVVLATSDGGRSWTKALDARALGPLLRSAYGRAGPHPPWVAEQVSLAAAHGDASLLGVWFEDERTGFVVGAFNLVLRTDDGGRSWTPWLDRTDNAGGRHLHAVRRVAGDLWIVGEQGLVLKLDRDGERFTRVAVPYAGSFSGVTGRGRTVVVHGLRGNAFRSEDGGRTWRRSVTGVDATLTGGTATADGRLVLVTLAGQVLTSADAGRSFRAARSARAGPPAAAVVARGGRLVIAGAGGARIEPLEVE
jgi:photosystem II stability/assembly factor-like uncharacterized protein